MCRSEAIKTPSQSNECSRTNKQNSRIRLTPGTVMAARKLYRRHSRNCGIAALARQFGVSENAMRCAVMRKSWRGVTDCAGTANHSSKAKE